MKKSNGFLLGEELLALFVVLLAAALFLQAVSSLHFSANFTSDWTLEEGEEK